MAAYLIRRLWQMIPTLVGVVLLVFLLFKFFGGDPAEIMAGLNATPEQVQAIRDQLGLNSPWYVQLWINLKSIVTFDWGRSFATNETVANIFATRLPATLTVMTPILVLDTLLALPIAMWVAYRRGSISDRAIMVISTVALSVSFLVYIIIGQYIFGFSSAGSSAGLERLGGEEPGHLRAAAGAAGAVRRRRAADAPVPHLLPRRARPRLRAHRAKGDDREDGAVQARAAQRDDPDPHQHRPVAAGHLRRLVPDRGVLLDPGLGREVILAVNRSDYPVIRRSLSTWR
jgi:peptide/nickel transport system permease protein